jgi:hypothetical protein
MDTRRQLQPIPGHYDGGRMDLARLIPNNSKFNSIVRVRGHPKSVEFGSEGWRYRMQLELGMAPARAVICAGRSGALGVGIDCHPVSIARTI